MTTWKYRIKDSVAKKHLKRHARAVNQVWNESKQKQIDEFLSNGPVAPWMKIFQPIHKFGYQDITKGKSKIVDLHSHSIAMVCTEYATRVKQFKKSLRWRGRRSLGWIPFRDKTIIMQETSLVYMKRTYKLWIDRQLPEDAKIKCGSFTEDSQGRWYVNITFESTQIEKEHGNASLGLDIGIKSLATMSDGTVIERPDLRKEGVKELRRIELQRRYTKRYNSKLEEGKKKKQPWAKDAKYRSLPKRRAIKKFHAKITNRRKDYLHKETTKLVARAEKIFIGDVPCGLMNRNKKLSGISYDSGIGMFKQMLLYKSVRDGVTCKEVSEKFSTQTCSCCGWQHPKHARIGLGVRSWECPNCGELHDRDVNAARNILASVGCDQRQLRETQKTRDLQL